MIVKKEQKLCSIYSNEFNTGIWKEVNVKVFYYQQKDTIGDDNYS